jgi:uroporphyrinogen III methyltransferase/synthase
VQARELGAPRVIVTKVRAHAVPTMLALIDRGLAPISVPAIAVEPTADPRLDDAVRELDAFDWVVLTSRNAVAALADAAHRAGLCLPSAGSDGPRWAAVGRQTAAALELLGPRVAVCPAEATGAALAEAIPIEPGDRVLLPRGDLADTALPRRLEERGATVESIVAYRTLEAPPTSRELLTAALAQAPAGWIATSGSTVRGLVHLAADIGAVDAVRALPVIAIGRVTAAEAERHHLTVVTVAATPDPPGIADAAATLLAIRESRP